MVIDRGIRLESRPRGAVRGDAMKVAAIFDGNFYHAPFLTHPVEPARAGIWRKAAGNKTAPTISNLHELHSGPGSDKVAADQ